MVCRLASPCGRGLTVCLFGQTRIAAIRAPTVRRSASVQVLRFAVVINNSLLFQNFFRSTPPNCTTVLLFLSKYFRFICLIKTTTTSVIGVKFLSKWKLVMLSDVLYCFYILRYYISQ